MVPDASWTCGVPEGLAPPSDGALVMTITFDLGEIHDVGDTHQGHRRILDINGGSISGDLTGSVTKGSLDLELTLSNGNVELEQLNMMSAQDGTPIFLRVCGFAPSGDNVVRVIPNFEVNKSTAYNWLNTGNFAGERILDEQAGTITLKVYDMSNVTAPAEKVTLSDPDGVPNQLWECFDVTGGKGDPIFTESVGLGASISVGDFGGGSRNIIPITGGTVTGNITGNVLYGGADFQLLGGNMIIDARYTLETNDGELILIRNCGSFGALVPTFETSATGKYSYLNENVYVSSDPGGGAGGGVSITFYKRL
ncbi:MAG: DUF3237 family protein [Deltaproteobacteria bacterium]|nr:DUF3237 family protein [Deltaproteobacteria bacterium]